MYYTYVLWDAQGKRFYIGYTENIRRRIAEHLSGKNHTTLRYESYHLIFYEAFISKDDAVRREKYFKTTKGRTALRLMLRNSLTGSVTVAQQTLDLLV